MADAYLDLKTITGLSGGEYEMNKQRPGSFAPGQVVFLHAASGLVVLVLIQNRHSANFSQSDLVKKIERQELDDVDAGSDPRLEFTAAADITAGANAHIGSIAYVRGQGGDAPSGEYGIVAANMVRAVILDSDRPLSADLTDNDDIGLIPVYQGVPTDGDALTDQVLGVVIGGDGIDQNNFGFAQCFGVCPIAKHDGGALQANDLLVSSATAGRFDEHSANDDANIILGKALSDGPNTTADTFVAQIAVGPMATDIANADTN